MTTTSNDDENDENTMVAAAPIVIFLCAGVCPDFARHRNILRRSLVLLYFLNVIHGFLRHNNLACLVKTGCWGLHTIICC
jgi:hypothetical protein